MEMEKKRKEKKRNFIEFNGMNGTYIEGIGIANTTK